MSRHKNVMERMILGADLASEPLPMRPIIEIAGECRVLIENHHGVIKYSCEEIRIKVGYGKINVCGSGLKLMQMTKDRLVITGCIHSVQLLRGR